MKERHWGKVGNRRTLHESTKTEGKRPRETINNREVCVIVEQGARGSERENMTWKHLIWETRMKTWHEKRGRWERMFSGCIKRGEWKKTKKWKGERTTGEEGNRKETGEASWDNWWEPTNGDGRRGNADSSRKQHSGKREIWVEWRSERSV